MCSTELNGQFSSMTNSGLCLRLYRLLNEIIEDLDCYTRAAWGAYWSRLNAETLSIDFQVCDGNNIHIL